MEAPLVIVRVENTAKLELKFILKKGEMNCFKAITSKSATDNNF
jgi:hypothetical protein